MHLTNLSSFFKLKKQQYTAQKMKPEIKVLSLQITIVFTTVVHNHVIIINMN